MFVLLGVSVIEAVKPPIASAVTVAGAVAPFRKRATRAPGLVVPLTVTGDRLVKAGALSVSADGARNSNSRPAFPSAGQSAPARPKASPCGSMTLAAKL